MELHWAWYTLAVVGAYRMIAVCFEAVVRRTVHIARQSTAAEHSTPPGRAPRRAAPQPGVFSPRHRQLPSLGFAPGEGEGQVDR